MVYTKNGEEKAQKLAASAKRHGKPYITQTRKSFTLGRPQKYNNVIMFVKELVQSRWNYGNPLSKTSLYASITRTYSNADCEFNTCVLKSKNYPNSLHKFVQRTLMAINFTTRKSSIAQKVLDNWKELAILDA